MLRMKYAPWQKTSSQMREVIERAHEMNKINSELIHAGIKLDHVPIPTAVLRYNIDP